MRERFSTLIEEWQDSICAALGAVDGQEFREDLWQRAEGGGGRTRVLEGGDVFEKAGVNISRVEGPLPAAAARAMRHRFDAGLDLSAAQFFAAGISLVLHAAHPRVPTVHANFRYFELEHPAGDGPWWFGGGTDLTPNYLYDDDATHFHRTLKSACDAHDPDYYPRFKAWCDEYFWIRHRGEARGVGGIFFDDLNDRPAAQLLALVTSCAQAIVPAYLPIVERRRGLPTNDHERQWQCIRRGRYVEFNLCYDRGTRFGLETGARIESVLMSLPLVARWPYAHEPRPGSEEARLVEVLKTPRDWV